MFPVVLTDDSFPFVPEEFLSVYIGNLSPSTSVFDLEKVFKTFGRIKPDGVAIRSRKVSYLLPSACRYILFLYC
jgi:RNA recognition motif-containing protein